MAVGRFLPLRGQIPVIGNVVVVENHQRRQVRQRSGDVAQSGLETVDARLFQRITLTSFLDQLRRFWRDQRPGRWRPDQQVHRHDFGKRHQVIVGAAASENRLARPTEEAITQGFVAFQCRQQIGAVVVAGGVAVQRGTVGDHCAFEVFFEQAQTFDQGMNRPQSRPGYVVGIHLIATHHQQRRAIFGFVFLRQQVIHTQQTVGRRVMRLAARAVQQLIDA
ncbi:hypothetical protein D3C87_1282760 [compost metagenome]